MHLESVWGEMGTIGTMGPRQTPSFTDAMHGLEAHLHDPWAILHGEHGKPLHGAAGPVGSTAGTFFNMQDPRRPKIHLPDYEGRN